MNLVILDDACWGKMRLETRTLCTNDGQKMGSSSESSVFIGFHLH